MKLLSLSATLGAFLLPSRSRHVTAGKLALIGTIFAGFFLFTAGYHFPGGASHFPAWADAIVHGQKLPPQFAQREVGFPLLYILGGFPFTHSFIGITLIQAILAVLISVLVYWSVARASETIAFYTGLSCIISLSPFTYMKFFYPDQAYMFFNLLTLTLLIGFLWDGQFRMLYFFTFAAVAASFTRTAGNLMYPVLLTIAYVTVRGRIRHYVRCALIFAICAGLYQWHRYEIFDMRHQPSRPSGTGMQILYSTYLYLGDFGYRLSPDFGPNTRRLFERMREELKPTVRDSPLIKRALGDSPPEFYEKYFFPYTPEQLIEKISTEPNEEYYWNVVNAVDTNDQFFLEVAKEIARSHPWYVVQYSMRNLWHALFDPGYATPRYTTIGFSKTGNDFIPASQGWGVHSEDPVTPFGEDAAREMEYFQLKSQPAAVQQLFKVVEALWLRSFDTYLWITSALILIAWIGVFLIALSWALPTSAFRWMLVDQGSDKLIAPVIAAFALLLYEDMMTSLFSQPLYRYFHMTEPWRLVIAGFGLVFVTQLAAACSSVWSSVVGKRIGTIGARFAPANATLSRFFAGIQNYDLLDRYFGSRRAQWILWLIGVNLFVFAWWTSSILAHTRGVPAAEIVSATYGQSCPDFKVKAPSENTAKESQPLLAGLTNVTTYVQKACSGQENGCTFLVDNTVLGDPAPYCSKDFSITYRCPSDETVRTASIASAATGKTLRIECSSPGGVQPPSANPGDARRATDARVIKEALQRYHDKTGKYPSPLLDNSIVDLKPALADFLNDIPQDPVWGGSGKDYRYVSPDGNQYGIHVYLETGPRDASCITGVGFDGKGWWGQQKECPF